MLVGIASIDTEGAMVPPEVLQPSHLSGILVANGIVSNRWALRSPAQNPSNRPVLRVGRPLWSGEEVQVDPVFRNKQEVVDVLVDQPGLVSGPERSSDLN